jgi:hypothetical protein
MLKGLFRRPKGPEFAPLEAYEGACCGEALVMDQRKLAWNCVPGRELIPLSGFDSQALPNLYGQPPVFDCAAGRRLHALFCDASKPKS